MIYDCFTFFNELDLLDVRLHEHGSIVDRFVLVEATTTFQGKPKPLHFANNRHLFKKYDDKIIHVVVEFPPVLDNRFAKELNQTWAREYHQRDQFAVGLRSAAKDDLVIVSDVDEIVRGSTLREAVRQRPRFSLTVFDTPIYRYFVNRRATDNISKLRSCPRMIEFSRFTTGQKLRMTRVFMSKRLRGTLLDRIHTRWHNMTVCGIRSPIHLVPEAGWHFTSLGGWEMVRDKILAYSHTENMEWEVFKSRAAYDDDIKMTTRRVDDLELPESVRADRSRFPFFE